MLTFRPQNAKSMKTLADAKAKCRRPRIEAKYDGWRFIAVIDKDREPSIYSRTGKIYTSQTPEPILEELRRLPPHTILDGEMVDTTHNKNCVAVTNVFGKSRATPSQQEFDKLSYIVFDITRVNGDDTTNIVLEGRRALIERAFELIEPQRMALTPQAPAQDEYHDLVIEMEFEGIMVKDLDAPYAAGKRGHGWFKLKSTKDIDVVVMELPIDGKGQFEGQVGKMVVGQYQDGELIARARVNCPTNAERLAMTEKSKDWIGKVLTIHHYGVLKDGLRHPTFARWRPDKPAEDCIFDNG